jgi:hypothetical protein
MDFSRYDHLVGLSYAAGHAPFQRQAAIEALDAHSGGTHHAYDGVAEHYLAGIATRPDPDAHCCYEVHRTWCECGGRFPVAHEVQYDGLTEKLP